MKLLSTPKAAVAAVGADEYFDVEVRGGQIVLTPVRIQRGDAVRAKLSELGLTDADVAQAVAWARGGAGTRVAAEPEAGYTPRPRTARKTVAAKSSARRK